MKPIKDCLNRKKDLDILLQIISNAINNKERLSFAINGKWGSGKSYLIGMLQEELENKCYVFKYDSWDNDYYDDPLIGMLDLIKNEINQKYLIEKTLNIISLKILKEAASAIGEFLDNFIESKVGVRPIKSIRKIKKFLDDCKQEAKITIDFNSYNKLIVAKELIIASMNKLSKIRPIIFIVDELDRCLPTYALKIIERIHHISENISDCITMFAVDGDQLKTILELVYSKKEGMDKNYLRKVIDFTYSLDNGDFQQAALDCLADFKTKFGKPLQWFKEEEINCVINELFNSVEIRNTIKIINNAKRTHDVVFRSGEEFGTDLMCCELILSWAAQKYGKNMISRLESALRDNSDKTHILNYLRTNKSGYNCIYYERGLDRHFVHISDFKSFLTYVLLSNNNQYYPDYNPQHINIPSYVNTLMTSYSKYIIKIES